MIREHRKFELEGKIIFEKIILTPPMRVVNQMPDEACFLYMEEGEYDISAQSEHLRLRSKEAVLMRCGSYFTEFVKTITSPTCEVIIVHLYPDILKNIFKNELAGVISTVSNENPAKSVNSFVNHELIKVYIDSVKIYFDNPSLVNDELIVLKLKELLMLLMKTENAGSVGQLISSLFSQKEYSFREVIEAHLYTDFSIDRLALLTHQSVSSFKREFTKMYNDSPAHYFKQKKLERAADLLRMTNQRIGEIAFECGFNDLAHFSRSFQDKFGTSPSYFRMTQKNKSLS